MDNDCPMCTTDTLYCPMCTTDTVYAGDISLACSGRFCWMIGPRDVIEKTDGTLLAAITTGNQRDVRPKSILMPTDSGEKFITDKEYIDLIFG